MKGLTVAMRLGGLGVAQPGAGSPAAPPVQLVTVNPAGQHRPVGLETLTHDLQAEFVQAAERTQIRAHEGSVKHVEVFRLGGVGTPIIGRPRPSPRKRRAEHYTLNSEEPHTSPAQQHC